MVSTVFKVGKQSQPRYEVLASLIGKRMVRTAKTGCGPAGSGSRDRKRVTLGSANPMTATLLTGLSRSALAMMYIEQLPPLGAGDQPRPLPTSCCLTVGSYRHPAGISLAVESRAKTEPLKGVRHVVLNHVIPTLLLFAAAAGVQE